MASGTPHGFAFPFRFDAGSGAIATAGGDDTIRQSLAFLLQTELGERVLRRDFGAGLRGLLHEPMNAAFLQLARHQLGRAVTQHEPRVQLVDLKLAAGAGGVLEVELVYVVRQTQQAQALRLSLPTRI
jgi:phage baseplate assembly protein W